MDSRHSPSTAAHPATTRRVPVAVVLALLFLVFAAGASTRALAQAVEPPPPSVAPPEPGSVDAADAEGVRTTATPPSAAGRRPVGGPRRVALGAPTTPRDARAGSLLLRTTVPGVYLPAPTLALRFDVTVSGLVARTRLEQRFHNPTTDWVEGIYVYPLPVDAAVDTLRLTVGDRVIEGEIHERGEARRIYQEARAAGQRTALVEQEKRNLFTTSVANLGPDEELTVTIEYQELLRFEVRDGHGRIELRLPLTMTPQYQPGIPAELGGATLATTASPGSPATPEPAAAAAGGDAIGDGDDTSSLDAAARVASRDGFTDAASADAPRVEIRVDLRAGFALADLGSPSHAIHTGVEGGSTQAATAGRRRHLITLDTGDGTRTVPTDRDFVLLWEPVARATPQATLLAGERDGETHALLVVLPPIAPVDPLRRLAREIILVIDTSGSMQGTSIEQARQAIRWALDHLEPPDRFNLIRYSSDSRVLFASSQLATPEALSEAREWVRDLHADGGTETGMALARALSLPADPTAVRQLVLATDGAVGNEEALFAWLRRNLGDNRLFTVGIGSAPNALFMTGAAAAGRGTYTAIGRPEEVAGSMAALFDRLARPALTDLEASWDDPAADGWPRAIPDVYAGEALVVTARLPSGRTGVRLSGRLGDGPWEQRLDGPAPAPRSGIDRLWAARAVAGLLDGLISGRPEPEVRAEVLDVALRYGLVTRYTSLVAVDRTPANPSGQPPAPRPIPLDLPAGWQASGGNGGTLPQTASPATRDLLVGLGLLAAAALGSLLARTPRTHPQADRRHRASDRGPQAPSALRT